MSLRSKNNVQGWVAMALLLGSAPAINATEKGFYFGFGAGQSSFDSDQAAIDDSVLDAFASEGYSVVSATSDLDDSDTAFSGFVGYRFIKYFALEAAYIDLGELTYKANGTVRRGLATAPGSVKISGGSKGPAIAALAILPISDTFEIYARGGTLFSDTEVSASLRIGNDSGSDSLSENAVDSFVGVGAAVNFGANWSGRLEYTRYLDVGDEEETGEQDVDLLSVSFIYRL